MSFERQAESGIDSLADMVMPNEAEYTSQDKLNYPFLIFRQVDRVMLYKMKAVRPYSSFSSAPIEEYKQAVLGLHTLLLPFMAMRRDKKVLVEAKKQANVLKTLTKHNERILFLTNEFLDYLTENNTAILINRKREVEIVE